MATYLYPEAREMRVEGPELVDSIIANDPTFRISPIRNVNAGMIQWTLDDDDFGLQQLRGLDGAPLHVSPVGKGTYVSEPGYYGEFETVTEKELTERGGSYVGEVTIDIGDLVAQKNRQIKNREIRRIRYIVWTLLTTGTFSVSSKNGSVIHTDTFALQTHSGSDWSTAATGTPLADFRAVQQLGSAYGVEFGSTSLAVMNRVTANRLLSVTNVADIGGRRTTGGGTINSIDEVNRISLGEGLPELVVFDKGYKNDSGVFTKFIPDDKVVVVGTRESGDAIMEYRMTRNLNNPSGAPGSYEYIKDYAQGINAPKETPPRIEVHGGHNGGPVIYRPKALVVMSV
jgi:hypothetical protein